MKKCWQALDDPGREPDLLMVTDALSLRAARAEFFRDNGFPPGGGYDGPWQEAEFGPVHYRVPNPVARAEVLRIHDLHHLATGYQPDWRGEAEISAWELGSGLGWRLPYAWVIVLFGLFTGLVANLGPTFRAFARGRRSRNLYGAGFDPAMLEMRVSDLRAALSVPVAPIEPNLADATAFAAWSVVALTFGLLTLPLTLGLVVAGMVGQGWCVDCPLSSAPP